MLAYPDPRWTSRARGGPRSPTTTCAAAPSVWTSTTTAGSRSPSPATGARSRPSPSSDGPLLYRTRFELDAGPAGARHWVVLDGVFYQADVFLDGAYLGDPEGYFFPHSYEITDLARLGAEHVLAVEVACSPPTDRRAKRNLTGIFQHWDCMDPTWNPGGLWRARADRAHGTGAHQPPARPVPRRRTGPRQRHGPGRARQRRCPHRAGPHDAGRHRRAGAGAPAGQGHQRGRVDVRRRQPDAVVAPGARRPAAGSARGDGVRRPRAQPRAGRPHRAAAGRACTTGPSRSTASGCS